ncbi:hypothetical protein BC830DRAFT_1124190 [Chytriomyces sp. MP71]|nr:hypothetical protein BC830DRAFT_1124190 [Chytriomyces sp. MP71]
MPKITVDAPGSQTLWPYNVTAVKDGVFCLAPTLAPLITGCGITVTTNITSEFSSVSFPNGLKSALSCFCTSDHQSPLTKNVATCFHDASMSSLITTELATLCSKVNDAAGACSAAIDPFGDALGKLETSPTTIFANQTQALSSVCQNMAVVNFVNECTDLGAVLCPGQVTATKGVVSTAAVNPTTKVSAVIRGFTISVVLGALAVTVAL